MIGADRGNSNAETKYRVRINNIEVGNGLADERTTKEDQIMIMRDAFPSH